MFDINAHLQQEELTLESDFAHLCELVRVSTYQGRLKWVENPDAEVKEFHAVLESKGPRGEKRLVIRENGFFVFVFTEDGYKQFLGWSCSDSQEKLAELIQPLFADAVLSAEALVVRLTQKSIYTLEVQEHIMALDGTYDPDEDEELEEDEEVEEEEEVTDEEVFSGVDTIEEARPEEEEIEEEEVEEEVALTEGEIHADNLEMLNLEPPRDQQLAKDAEEEHDADTSGSAATFEEAALSQADAVVEETAAQASSDVPPERPEAAVSTLPKKRTTRPLQKGLGVTRLSKSEGRRKKAKNKKGPTRA